MYSSYNMYGCRVIRVYMCTMYLVAKIDVCTCLGLDNWSRRGEERREERGEEGTGEFRLGRTRKCGSSARRQQDGRYA